MGTDKKGPPRKVCYLYAKGPVKGYPNKTENLRKITTPSRKRTPQKNNFP